VVRSSPTKIAAVVRVVLGLFFLFSSIPYLFGLIQPPHREACRP
jgi:hypothetical protein